MWWKILILVTYSVAVYQIVDCLVEQDFTPQVTATCKAGYMTIKVQMNSSFIGALHAKDYRSSNCLTYGNGSNSVSLVVNLFASSDSPEYCGVKVSNSTGEERSLPIAVRIHKTLELADDKFYVITCGKAGFKNARNETSLVSLKILSKDKTRRLQEVFFSHPYVLRAQISKPDGAFGIKVRSCFAMNKRNNNVLLIDENGCPVYKMMSPFVYNASSATADSELYSMFEFPDGNHIHFQCDIVVCRGGCREVECDDLVPHVKDTNEEGVIVASTSAFVLQPGDTPTKEQIYEAGIGWGPSWLVYLAIALGLLFLLMLIVNVFLCSAMTCSCSRTEIVDKEPSIIDDYDPYRTWHASTHYGSRYSLNGKAGGGYMSGGSTLNSARSVSTNSDHYAIVDSRQRMAGGGPPSHYSRKH